MSAIFRSGSSLPATFTVTSGYLKGQHVFWSQELLTTGIPPDEPMWLPAGLALRFMRGYWHVTPESCVGHVSVNGQLVSMPTLLCLRDELEFDGVTLKVL